MWVAEWNKVVFTDESRICLQHQDGWIRVLRHRREKMLNSCIMRRHTGLTPSNTEYYGMGRYWISLSHSFSMHCRYSCLKTASTTSPRCWSQLSFLTLRAWP
ncbi:UNVERIFIED_CONTAM: hypothetical protein NCL1_17969 [Trichonephila clavipes]